MSPSSPFAAVLTALAVNTVDQPSSPLTVTFEFIAGASQVVATERLTIPAIPAQRTHQLAPPPPV